MGLLFFLGAPFGGPKGAAKMKTKAKTNLAMEALKKGFLHSDIRDATGLSPDALNRILDGSRQLTEAQAAALSAALKVLR